MALGDRQVIDLSRVARGGELVAGQEHPIVSLFAELEAKFRAGEVERPVSYYVTLGNEDLAKWTVRVDAQACDVRPGKPPSGQADCVLKTSPEYLREDRPRVLRAQPRRLPVGGIQIERRRASDDLSEGFSARPGVMKYLVTGATGFLGTHLVEALRATGDEVVPFARSTGGDVLDPRRLEQAAAGCDGVFHCAGMVRASPRTPRRSTAFMWRARAT